MQRIMQKLMERRGLAVWVEDRLLRLLKNGAAVHMARDARTIYIGESLTT